MVSLRKNNDLPDKETLRRYLQGKLPPDEAHRIEKLILNNPLYQDALDGLETLSEEELKQDLKDISQQISERTQTSSKDTKINVYRIAAAILVLAVLSYIIIYTTARMEEVSKNGTLSQKQEVRDEVEQIPAESQVVETDTAFRSVKPADLQNQLSETDIPAREKAGTEQEVDITVADPLKEISEERIDIAEEKSNRITVFSETRESGPVQQVEESAETVSPEEAVEKPSPEESREVLAVVAAEPTTEREVEDAYFQERKEESREESPLDEVDVSDFREGEEELSLIDQEHDLETERAKISVKPAPVSSDYRDSVEDKRKENKMARQAVSQAAKAPEATYETLANAEISNEGILKPVPVDGYEIYADYISENLKYPAEEFEDKIKGSVKLRFIINKDSIPDRINVIQSLSPGCDKEARRLLREGPKWIPAYKDRELDEVEIEYYIYFTPEE